ncbi:unnamed protein product, partial [Closterium sp. NIES-53]
MSGLLLLVRSAAAARARVAGVVVGAAGVVVGAAVEAAEAVEVVTAVGVVERVGPLVAEVEAAVGVAVVAAVAVVVVGLELSVEVREEASGSGSSVRARPRHPSSFTCGKAHTQQHCFFRLDDAWRTEFGDEVEPHHWTEFIRSGIEAAALGADKSSLPGTEPAKALHTFTLDSGASRCFFRDSTTLTPLPAPVPVRLADPSGGPVVARSSTVLSCLVLSSCSVSVLHLPRSLRTCRRPGSSLYTLATEPPQVAASALVAVSCSCRLLSHQNLLWNHRLGHPSLPRLRGMHSRLLVSGLPRSLPPLPPSPALPCLPCVEGRQRAGVGGAGAGGAGAIGAGAVGPGAGGAGGTMRPRLYFVPLLQQFLGVAPAVLQSTVSLYLVMSRLFALLVAFLVRVLLLSLACTLWHSVLSVPLPLPLPAPPESSFLEVPDPESDRARAASPTVSRLLATVVTDPSFDSSDASALVAELLDFAAASRLDYATALVAESASARPPSVGGECALGTDVLEDMWKDLECLAAAISRFASMLLAPEGDPDAPDIPNPRSYAEAITGPYSSQRQAAMDAEMASWKSTGTYVDEVPPPGANIVNDMWIFRCSFLAGQPAGTQWSPRRPVYGLCQVPHDWHVTLRTTLAALGFSPSTADPSLFLCTDTSLPPFYVLVYVDDLSTTHHHTYSVTHGAPGPSAFGFKFSSPQPTPLSTGHSLSAPPSDKSVEPSGPYPELVGCLIYLMTTSGMGLVLGGRGPVVLTGHADASWVDDSATSSCEAEIYAGTMAAQELR